MKTEGNYIHLLNSAIKSLFNNAFWITLRRPSLAFFVFKTLWQQKKAAKRRLQWEAAGVHVPPFMIASITNRCNLHCKGCYAMAQHRSSEAEMSDEKLRGVLKEADELGISIALLAGGEPFVRQGLLEVTKDYPKMIFPIFTNGLLLNDEMLAKLQAQRHVIPVISLEGYQEDTDDRRGQGVYEHLQGILQKLESKGLFFGVSLTVTRSNYATITSDEFVKRLIDLGCKLFFYVEYIPVKAGTEDWVLDDEQSGGILRQMDALRSKFRGLFIAFPGDEAAFGGCLSSGRGFVHISPSGRVEPCPFAPYSDASLQEMSLQDALKSEFLMTIRENHEKLSEREGGCALWENREWVSSLLQKQHPGQTDTAQNK